MSQIDPQNPLVIILGPTAVGKTEIAIQVAERVDGEIVSADSRLFYRGMDIGTAKPNRDELARVPHHLIDCADPDEIWSLALFQQRASQAIQTIQQRGRLPILVGGTGQYIRAVSEGWLPPEQPAHEDLRRALEHWASTIGAYELHRKLRVLDSMAAAAIDPPNVRRTIRALEVILSTGRLFSTQRTRKPSPYSLLQIGLIRTRQELYARMDARIDAMLAAGFLQEVQDLLKQGYSSDLPSLSAIGYRELCAHLRGEITLDEAVIRIRRQSRQFVRRQANWFKADDPNINWFSVGENTVDQVINLIWKTYRAA